MRRRPPPSETRPNCAAGIATGRETAARSSRVLDGQALIAQGRDVPVGMAEGADLERSRQLRHIQAEPEVDVVARIRVHFAGFGDLPVRYVLDGGHRFLTRFKSLA